MIIHTVMRYMMLRNLGDDEIFLHPGEFIAALSVKRVEITTWQPMIKLSQVIIHLALRVDTKIKRCRKNRTRIN